VTTLTVAITFFFSAKSTLEEGDDNTCHRLFLLCNTTIEEDNGTLPSSSSFQTQRKK